MIVDAGVYDQRERCDGDYSIEGAAAYLREHPGSFCWTGLRDPKDGEVAEVGRTFPLPALAVEDAEHAHLRDELRPHARARLAVRLPGGPSR